MSFSPLINLFVAYFINYSAPKIPRRKQNGVLYSLMEPHWFYFHFVWEPQLGVHRSPLNSWSSSGTMWCWGSNPGLPQAKFQAFELFTGPRILFFLSNMKMCSLTNMKIYLLIGRLTHLHLIIALLTMAQSAVGFYLSLDHFNTHPLYIPAYLLFCFLLFVVISLSYKLSQWNFKGNNTPTYSIKILQPPTPIFFHFSSLCLEANTAVQFTSMHEMQSNNQKFVPLYGPFFLSVKTEI